jgi:hypothetical protein
MGEGVETAGAFAGGAIGMVGVARHEAIGPGAIQSKSSFSYGSAMT